ALSGRENQGESQSGNAEPRARCRCLRDRYGGATGVRDARGLALVTADLHCSEAETGGSDRQGAGSDRRTGNRHVNAPVGRARYDCKVSGNAARRRRRESYLERRTLTRRKRQGQRKPADAYTRAGRGRLRDRRAAATGVGKRHALTLRASDKNAAESDSGRRDAKLPGGGSITRNGQGGGDGSGRRRTRTSRNRAHDQRSIAVHHDATVDRPG